MDTPSLSLFPCDTNRLFLAIHENTILHRYNPTFTCSLPTQDVDYFSRICRIFFQMHLTCCSTSRALAFTCPIFYDSTLNFHIVTSIISALPRATCESIFSATNVGADCASRSAPRRILQNVWSSWQLLAVGQICGFGLHRMCRVTIVTHYRYRSVDLTGDLLNDA